MALSQAALKQNLLTLFNQMRQDEMSEADYADKLSKIINDHILTADVVVNAGIPVSTAGTETAQTGATTATGTGKLS